MELTDGRGWIESRKQARNNQFLRSEGSIDALGHDTAKVVQNAKLDLSNVISLCVTSRGC